MIPRRLWLFAALLLFNLAFIGAGLLIGLWALAWLFKNLALGRAAGVLLFLILGGTLWADFIVSRRLFRRFKDIPLQKG
ncbi:MAG: hypothetical protein LBQ61_03825 [Spirochaetales bacterium]|jgi:hypothetical protein|nr:hypothetical protein [Spirochaetales bacterium]